MSALSKARDVVRELEQAERSAPQSAEDILKRHDIKEARVQYRVDPWYLGHGSGSEYLKCVRKEAMYALAEHLLRDQHFELIHHGTAAGSLMTWPERDTYSASLVALSMDKLKEMLREAYAAGRNA